ncbi:MAG: FAD-binding protein [Epsilonproteobacteria bacterium]|nr:FAD-binding protein [Campylobacterota bacterium]
MAKVLVIGAGGAGLSAAISAKEAGAEVILVTKEYPTRSQTCMAQGGINAALHKEDSIQQHIEDTLISAKGLGDKKMIELLCQNAPQTITWLNQIGVPFSRTEDGKIAQRKLGGASAPRACYAQDYTGLKILHTLYDYANKLNIIFLNELFLLELIINDGSVTGALFLDIKTGKTQTIYADSIILAGGGYSKIYNQYSTNSKAASGDVIAVAMRAGVHIRNMEFVQFHPTALKNSAILISESARGAGGKLLNSKEERFVDELKPRDAVSQAIFDEIQKGENIFLDITHLGEKFIDEELPQERKLAKLYEGIDPVYEKIPIKPVAHYTMGGIAVNESMQTNIQNLFAVGECSEAKVHGANRLGGNSLLEIVVFGRIAGEKASLVKTITQTNNKHTFSNLLAENFNASPTINFYEQQQKLGELLYKDCGIKRNASDLKKLLDNIETMKEQLPSMGVSDNSQNYNTHLIDFLEFKNRLFIAQEVVLSALNNTQSIGAHFRTDT